MKENVLLIDMGDTGSEVEAIRQALEWFGYKVLKFSIGRPNDFLKVLEGYNVFNYKYIIISCHGIDDDESAKIIMPKLHESVYSDDEPKGDFDAEQITKYNRLKDKVIISTGCTTGDKKLALAFVNSKNIYIAPDGYPEGSSSLMFAISLFYQLQKNNDIKKAYETAKNTDDETGIFKLYND